MIPGPGVGRDTSEWRAKTEGYENDKINNALYLKRSSEHEAVLLGLCALRDTLGIPLISC